MSKKLWSPELGGILPNWLTDEEKARCYCDDRGWVLVHLDGNEEVIVAGGRYNDPAEKGHGFDPVTGKSLDSDRDPAHGINPEVYNLGSSTSSFNEGSSVSVQLTTENVPDGPISYTISGIESEDLVSGSLTGQFDLVNGSAFINLELVEDQTTEGDQVITLTLDNGQTSVNINARDTSLNPPVYNLSAPASINEGQDLTISLSTENVSNGTDIAYTITGIDQADLSSGSLTGNFTVGSVESIILGISSDLSFEEGNETLTLTLDGLGESVSVVVNDTSIADPIYNLSAPTSANEGDSLTISLSTQYVSAGTPVPYTITGIDQADLSSGYLTGNFVVGTTDSINLGIAEDLSFEEGNETLTLTLDGTSESVSVNIVDSSVADPIYSLSSSLSEVNEGQDLTISLSTQYVSAGTSVPYTITGISQADLSSGSLTGNFVVGTTDSITVSISEDLSFEEGNETLTLTIDGTSESVSVVVNDTSIADSVYSLSAPASVNEGDSLTISLSTQYVSAGTSVPYTITGIQQEDLFSGALTGNFVVGTTDSIILGISSDLSFEEGNETLTLTLDGLGESVDVIVNDTSIADPIYSLSSLASVDEGQDLTISLSTQYVSNGTNIPYTITGISQADLSAGSLTGNFTVGSVESVTLSIAEDLSFEEGNETLTLTLDGLGESVDVIVNDTSTATSAYFLSTVGDVTFVNEGDSLTISLSTQYVSNGTVIPYTLGGTVNLAEDFDSALNSSGQFVAGSSESATFNLKNDLSFEEGDETLTLSLDGLNTSISIVVKDTSRATEVYSLSAPTSANEGDSLTISLSTQYVSAGTVVDYTLGGTVNLAEDFDSALNSSGQFVVGSDESATFNLKNDLSFEEGNETLTLTLDGLGESVSVNIVDSSVADPIYSLSAPASANEGQDLTISLSTQYVSDGTSVPYTITGISQADLSSGSLTGNFVVGTTDSITVSISEDLSFEEGNETLTLTIDGTSESVSVNIVDTSIADPIYSLSAPASVNEGQDLTISLSTQYVSNGTNISYTISGISQADLSAGSLTGNFVVGTVDSITLGISSDASFEEGDETLTLTLDGLGESVSVNIVDSSVADPIYSLSAPASINEGQDLTISLSTQYVSAGTSVPYTITGISQADLSSGSLSGNFIVGTTDSITLGISEDLSDNEGNETLRLTLTGTTEYVDVIINDTSKAPEYNLSSSPIGDVDEGNPLVITLNAVNVEPNTTIAYSVTGISSADLDTGSAALSGGLLLTGSDSSSVSGSLTFNIKADALTEPTPESLILSLDGNVASISVVINDTSQTPFYTLSSSHPAGIDEGQDLTISLATNVDSGTSIPYTISGIDQADLSSGSLSGNFVVGTTDSITLGISSDVTSGEGDETLTLTLTNQNQTIDVTINDTSTTAPASNEPVDYQGSSLYMSGISSDGQVAGWNAPPTHFHVFTKNGSTWEYSTTITPSDPARNTKSTDRIWRNISFNNDGSVVLLSSPRSPSGGYTGTTWIYRRQPDGSYNLDQTIASTGAGYWAWRTKISADGSTIGLHNLSDKVTHIYKYDGTSFVPFDQVYVSETVNMIDLSSDGSSLYIGGPYAASATSCWFSKFSLNNGSYTLEIDKLNLDVSFPAGVSGLNVSNNEKLMAVESYPDGTGQVIDILDYDNTTSTWIRRTESITEPSLTTTHNAFGQTDMSEPDSNGIVTLTNNGGRTYQIPGTLP